MTLDDLGDRLFADIPQAASILGRDERTVRRAAAAGEIPATKVGTKWMIRTSWLREQAGVGQLGAASAAPDLDELADRLADRMFARLAGLFAGHIGSDTEAA
jgi:excisionase family DNA binding protein